jgi:DNA helicase II / ATP-dependent DNA helicase PcrA
LQPFLAKFLVKHIQEQLSSGQYGVRHKVAFIYRTNAQSRLLEEACVRYNVPYVVFGSFTSFYNRQEIKDCLCFLRWLHNGRDRIAMLRAIETPKRGLGDTAIREFDEYCSLVDQVWGEQHPELARPNPLDVLLHLSGDYSWCPIETPQFPPPSSSLSSRPLKLLADFSRQMIQIRNVASKTTVAQTLQYILDALDLKPHFDKISKSKDEYEERLSNVDELQKAAMRYEKDGTCLPIGKTKQVTVGELDVDQSPLGYFLDDISLVTELADSTADKFGEERFVASLMTIHSSKGMEFDSVYFVGVEDGTIPSTQVSSMDISSTALSST